jgi:hypothetical protein
LIGPPLRDQDVASPESRAIDDPLEVLKLVVRPAIKEGNPPESTIGVTCVERQATPKLPNFLPIVNLCGQARNLPMIA